VTVKEYSISVVTDLLNVSVEIFWRLMQFLYRPS